MVDRIAAYRAARTLSDLPLVDQSSFRDACGVGMIAARDGRATFRMVRLAVECLERLDHRGAKAADGTGDGAGLLTEIPYVLFARELRNRGLRVPPPGRFGVVTAFLPPGQETESRELIAGSLEYENIKVLGWRPVPTDSRVLGGRASASMPVIEQVMVEAPDDVEDHEDFERRLFLARKYCERRATLMDLPGFAIASASSRTIVYKGLFAAKHVADFFWDLRDPSYETSFAIFHQRYSTNTFPAWEIAQPFRTLAHNGEINTVNSNRSWMAAREVNPSSPMWADRSRDLRPFLQADQSDSGSLDNAFELLVRSGRHLGHVKEMLMPAAWENVVDLAPELRSFYEYHAFLSEPWDGPAAVAATDGISLLAGVDRNGLRPARWTLSNDVFLVASEAGICPEEEAKPLKTGQLGPGEAVVFDPRTDTLRFSDELLPALARLQPYREWISTETLYVQDPFNEIPEDRLDVEAFGRVFGYTAEDRRMVLEPKAEGKTPTGSMGSDTPLAALSETPRRLTHYFHQLFAQVTNPPMDPIREKLVMSLRTYLGRRGSLLEETPQQAALMELASPILSDTELERIARSGDSRFFSYWVAAVFRAEEGPGRLKERLEEIVEEVVFAVRGGASIVILSDRETDAEHAPIPMPLAVSAVHHRLISEGIRLEASIVCATAETRTSHDAAVLLGLGASAINPYLAIEEVRRLAVGPELAVDPVVAQENYRMSMQNGLLKIMSKMGICTLSAYRGSELFELIGLADDVCEAAFLRCPRRVGGIGFEELGRQVLAMHAEWHADAEGLGGFYKHRRGGAVHVTSPSVVLRLQKAVRSGDMAEWAEYIEAIEDRPPSQLRDLLRFREVTPVPLDEVEPVERIMRRFVTAAMSLGALSKEAHEALAEATSMVGGLSNSGEGGENPARFGTPRNSDIKQVASGRFGVTPGYLSSAEEYQIKMAQGSKPGEGGQLPGHKVTREIAWLRHTEPGVSLISPPPHHDIYSIEDLAQLIYDLKAFKPTARVSVKLVSEPGVGTVAVGVAKAQADAITISGSDGGTGASPLVSIKHAGSPWELGIAEAHQVLIANGLRARVALETDGGIRTGRDVVIAALLGAERFGFGTLPLLALGCKMVRQCHENTCPVGIATQREDLRAKFTGAPDQVVQLFRMLAEEVRGHLASLGVRAIEEMIGRADLLEPVDPDNPVAASLAPLLVRADGRRRHPGYVRIERSELSERLVREARHAVETGAPIDLAFPITNEDRTIGSTLAGEIAARYGDSGLESGTINVRLAGTAGQSFGAWLVEGISLRLDGPANDYVGKGMGGGRIVIVPRQGADAPTAHAGGNAVMYGATGGKLFMSGTAGQRFCVRNSGGWAVVEGISDHGCEYMTGGTAVVLGPVGRNFGAGMTGGIAYVWDPESTLNTRVAESAPSMRRLGESDATVLRAILEEHVRETGSRVAQAILDDWDRNLTRFWVLATRGSVPVHPTSHPDAVSTGA